MDKKPKKGPSPATIRRRDAEYAALNYFLYDPARAMFRLTEEEVVCLRNVLREGRSRYVDKAYLDRHLRAFFKTVGPA